MPSVIGDLLPAAVAIALSPFPIIGVVLILDTPRARSNGPAFVVGWVAGMVLVSTIVILVAGDASDPTDPLYDSINWIKVAFGALFLVLAAKQWRTRPRDGAAVDMPAWMTAIDSFTPGKSLMLGAALSAANPKNLVLTLAGAASIAQAGLTSGENVAAVAVFVTISSISVAGLVVFYLVAAERAARPLASVKEFMSQHNAAIMTVVLLLLGAKLIGEGLG